MLMTSNIDTKRSFEIETAFEKIFKALTSEFPTNLVIINLSEHSTLIENVLAQILQSVVHPIEIYDVRRGKDSMEIEKYSYLILTSSVKTLSIFLSRNHTQHAMETIKRTKTFRRNFLLVYNSNTTESSEHFEFDLNVSPSYFFSMKTFEDGSLGLYRRVPLADSKCRSNFEMINSFNVSTRARKWTNEDFKFGKFNKKFHNCSVIIDHAIIRVSKQLTLTGLLNSAFLKMFGDHHELIFKHASRAYDQPQIFIYNEKQYLNPKENDPLSNLHLSSPLSIIKVRFLVTRGLSYSPSEKMILPFDHHTWILIISSIVIGLVMTTFFAKNLGKQFSRLIFGQSNLEPTFNLVRIIFGIGMMRVPTGNFARFLVIIFLLYCIVIRTAYQGKLFEFMTADVRRSTPQTIEELFERKVPVLAPHFKIPAEDEMKNSLL